MYVQKIYNSKNSGKNTFISERLLFTPCGSILLDVRFF